MSSETTMVAEQCRLQEWVAQILSQQEQLKQIDHNLQLVLEQMSDLKRHRFGRSSERHETEDQISFMEVDGKIVFFNGSEAVSSEEPDGSQEDAPRQKPKKKQGKREEGLSGLPVVVVEHSMDEKELEEKFGQEGWKQLPDEIYRRYRFTPAKIEVEEHHVKVYAGKKTEEAVKASHPECFLKGSLVSPSLEAAVMNAKYVNAVPLYRQEQEFERYGLHISRQNMANWTRSAWLFCAMNKTRRMFYRIRSAATWKKRLISATRNMKKRGLLK